MAVGAEQVSSLPSVNGFVTASRGQRLFPPADSRAYWVLTSLRLAYEDAIERFVEDGKSKTVVDFGCGNMPYRPLFERCATRYIGCDLPGNEVADLVMPAPDVLPLANESADVVLSSQVLEHVLDPATYLAEAHRVVKRGGLLFLSTHGMWKYHPDPFDLWRWTSAGLRRIIVNAGFTVVSFRGILGREACALQLWQDYVLGRLRPTLQPWFQRYMQWRIRRADAQCTDVERDTDASVYVVVARRTSQ